MTMLFRKKYILAVVETTYGTDPTPDGANAILTKNLAPSFMQGNRVTRDLDRPTLGNDAEIATGRFTQLSFDVEIAGSGAAGTAPGWGPLLRACGFDETILATTSVTYQPVSEDFESLTIYFYMDGELHKLTGARGTVSLNLSRDQIPVMSFTFTGLYNDPAAPGSIITPDNSAFVKPLAVNKANTPTYLVDSHPVRAEGFTLDMANEVPYRNVVNSESVMITDRAPAGTLAFEEVRIGTKNFWQIAKNETLVPVSIIHGTTEGNIVEIASTRVQLSQPSVSDSDGIAIMNMATRFVPSSSGDDEVSIIVR